MLQFVQSIWLWAAAGIIIPVIIHLWNVKQGKTLKVGSIAFFTESEKSHAKSLNLSEMLLLLLRCLLVIVLAILIASPFYVRQLNSQTEKGWILIERQDIHEAYNKFKPGIDTLIKSGYSFHYLEPGFKQAKFEEALKMQADSVRETNFSYWSLLKQLDQAAPANLPLHLFTNNSLAKFSGSRPDVSLNVKWHVYTSPNTASGWIEKAYKTTSDSLRLVIANSTPAGTSFTFQNISSNDINNKYNVIYANGKTYVKFKYPPKDVSNTTVEVDTSTLVISIYTDKFTMDANYLRAAINAIRDVTKRKIKVSAVNNVQSIPATPDWLFWLSEETIPQSLKKNNVFVYEKGKVENVRARLITDEKVEATTPEDLRVFKMISANRLVATEFNAVWKSGLGQPVLSVEKKAGIYHFYSRFNPQWNDLPWSNKFPTIILNLLFNNEKSISKTNEADKRIFDPTQMQPVITAETNADGQENLTEKKDLSKIIWAIAFILFLTERLISSKTKKEMVYG